MATPASQAAGAGAVAAAAAAAAADRGDGKKGNGSSSSRYDATTVAAQAKLLRLGVPSPDDELICRRIIRSIRDVQQATDEELKRHCREEIVSLVEKFWSQVDPMTYARLAFIYASYRMRTGGDAMEALSVFTPIDPLVGHRLSRRGECVAVAAACALTRSLYHAVYGARFTAKLLQTLTAFITPPAEYTPVHHKAYNEHILEVLNISPRFFLETKQRIPSDCAIAVAQSVHAREQLVIWEECDFNCVELPTLVWQWERVAVKVPFAPQTLALLGLYEHGIVAKGYHPFDSLSIGVVYKSFLEKKAREIASVVFPDGTPVVPEVPDKATITLLVVAYGHFTKS